MPRPAIAAHVLAHLRKQLGLLQKELADEVHLSRRTIQDIERGRLRLSRKNAALISERFHVNIDWLLANDPNLPMTVRSGRRPWTGSDEDKELETDAELLELYRSEPGISRIMRAIVGMGLPMLLLADYLRFRTFFQKVSADAAREWFERREQAWVDFLKKNPQLQEYDDRAEIELFFNSINKPKLESIKDDVDVAIEIMDAAEHLRQLLVKGKRKETGLNGEGEAPNKSEQKIT